MNGKIISLDKYRKKTPPSPRKKALGQSIFQLKLILARVDIYQAQMERLAQTTSVQEICAEKDIQASQQIQSDVKRLKDLVQALLLGLEEKGAKDLRESSVLLRYWAPAEVVETLDLVLTSDYEGFQKIAQVLDPIQKTFRKAQHS